MILFLIHLWIVHYIKIEIGTIKSILMKDKIKMEIHQKIYSKLINLMELVSPQINKSNGLYLIYDDLSRKLSNYDNLDIFLENNQDISSQLDKITKNINRQEVSVREYLSRQVPKYNFYSDTKYDNEKDYMIECFYHCCHVDPEVDRAILQAGFIILFL